MANMYEDGELIVLWWDGEPEAYYVKGWHSQEHVTEQLIKEEIINSSSQVSIVNETYARWNIGRDECGEPMSFLHQKDGAGRGRFKVTEVKLDSQLAQAS